MRSLLPYAQLVRLPNTFTALADIFLGALATGFLANRGLWIWRRFFPSDSPSTVTIWQELASWGTLLCLLTASMLLYWSGMIWNDYFDVNQDRRERPGRPLACGLVPLRTAMWLALGCQTIALVLALGADVLSAQALEAPIRMRSLPIAVLLVFAIFLYDGVFKASFAGPIFMGACRFLNILLGLSILGAWPPAWGWLIALVIGVYIAGVTWFARTEAQHSNQTTLIAAAIVILLSLLLALTVPAVALEAREEFYPSRFFPYLLALFGAYLGIAIFRAIRRPEPMCVQPAIKRAVLGLVVLDALLASAFVGSFGLLLVILLIPGIILGRWLYST
ncbi:MAG TPA: UbiA family prenyltransferase [Gemmataceae bacterium]|nr:UbiA family prenyltransferase [Gemmataceae bacterium]